MGCWASGGQTGGGVKLCEPETPPRDDRRNYTEGQEMTVRVRLQRFGRRNRPFYRVVVADSRAPRDGKFIELVGTYNPLATRSGVKEVTFKVDRIRYWVSVGAQPSDRVAWLLGQFGILPPKVVPVARTKQILPRKERKELKKQQQAGGKGFHTSAAAAAAASYAAFQPSCYAGSGEPTGALSPSDLGAGVGGGVAADQIPEERQQYRNAGIRFESPLSFGWATGEQEASVDGSSSSRSAASSSTRTRSDSDVVGDGIAARLSHMSLNGRDGGEQQARSMDAPDSPSPISAFSPLDAVLASHFALLGPAACSAMGLRVNAEGPRGTR